MDPLARYARALNDDGVRYVVIGAWGAGYYTRGAVFLTEDQDLFLPPDPGNLLAAWRAAERLGLELMGEDEPLDMPRDEDLARAVVQRRALTHVCDGDKLSVDLSLVMTGFDFDTVYGECRRFRTGDVEVPVARLAHIVESKAKTGRDKDRLFLTVHADALLAASWHTTRWTDATQPRRRRAVPRAHRVNAGRPAAVGTTRSTSTPMRRAIAAYSARKSTP